MSVACNSGGGLQHCVAPLLGYRLPFTATLIVVLRASAHQSARAGAYSGTLTLLVAPN